MKELIELHHDIGREPITWRHWTAKVASSLERGAPKEVQPVDSGTKNDTPHF